MNAIKILTVIIMCCLSFAGSAAPQDPQSAPASANEKLKEKHPKIFDSEEMLTVALEYDINALKGDRGNIRSFHPARFSYKEPDGRAVVMDVKIKTRGRLRRQLLDCLVPNFKIEFNKEQTKGTLFRKEESLKVVAHCKNSPAFFQHYYLKEYLLYKLYNQLSEYSFRVRPVQFVFTDSQKKRETFSAYGFFIESYEEMIKRFKAEEIADETEIALTDFDLDNATLLAVFEFMIGNTDWSVQVGHNTRRFRLAGNPRTFAVPFDFDLSGAVDAHYATPAEGMPIKTVRDRYFRGYNRDIRQFNKIFDIFRAKKAAMEGIIRDFQLLPDSARKKMLDYLEDFFRIINDSALTERFFVNNYRGRPRPVK